MYEEEEPTNQKPAQLVVKSAMKRRINELIASLREQNHYQGNNYRLQALLQLEEKLSKLPTRLTLAGQEFELLSILGEEEGNFSQVYKCWWPSKSKFVAAKRIVNTCTNLQTLLRWRRSTNIERMHLLNFRLRYSHLIVSQGDYLHPGTEDRWVFLELADMSLQTVLADSLRKLDDITLVRYAHGVALGVHYLHHVVNPPLFHGDLTARNILIDGETCLSDFGTSKFQGQRLKPIATRHRGTDFDLSKDMMDLSKEIFLPLAARSSDKIQADFREVCRFCYNSKSSGAEWARLFELLEAMQLKLSGRILSPYMEQFQRRIPGAFHPSDVVPESHLGGYLLACSVGYTSAVERLLHDCSFLHKREFLLDGIDAAVRNGRMEVLKLINPLIEKHHRLSVVYPAVRIRPAIMYDHREIVEMAAQCGGVTVDEVLCLAAAHGQTNLVEAMVSRASNIDYVRVDGTALHYASMYGFDDIAVCVLKKGASCTFRTVPKRDCLADFLVLEQIEPGLTALDLAVIHGNITTAEILLDYKAPLETSEDGRNSLYYAVYYERYDCVELLLKRGATVHIKNANFLTPLQLAAKHKQVGILKLLLAAVYKQTIGFSNIQQ